ncbi:MAG: sortase [Eubacteriales bacterium]|nr:sortase [Eubacteriales bacterium]
MRIKRGTLPTALGLVLIAGALALSGYNLRSATQAETASVQAVAQLEQLRPEPKPRIDAASLVSIPDMELPDYVLCPEMEMPEKLLNGRAYIGTLEIPALALELPVISRWSYPAFQVSPCRYQGSAYTDDLILAAHNYPAHFGRIKELNVGDRLSFTDMDGNVFSYQVVAREILEPEDVEAMEAGGYALTLFTCTLGGQHRVTVRCDRAPAEV